MGCFWVVTKADSSFARRMIVPVRASGRIFPGLDAARIRWPVRFGAHRAG